MYFKTYILKREVNNKQLEITRSFDLDNLICTATEILKDNEIDLIITNEVNNVVWRNEKSTPPARECLVIAIEVYWHTLLFFIISHNLKIPIQVVFKLC
ncbi:hypothetical protein [Clostridioides difficile]|uniref:hypothetical protein n=1 Tax=Clostridioides difficile TaxID=1496 RepID=UPI00103379F1|nr:hypothetical protein [Clostridioides difficile]